MAKAVACISKNPLAIDDWIAWHLALGFDKVFLGCHSPWRYSGMFKGHPKLQLLDVVGHLPQLDYYNRISNKLAKETSYSWLAVVDDDEYIQPKGSLDSLLPLFSCMPGICMHWKFADGVSPFKATGYAQNGHAELAKCCLNLDFIRKAKIRLRFPDTHWPASFPKVHQDQIELWHYFTGGNVSKFIQQKVKRGYADLDHRRSICEFCQHHSYERECLDLTQLEIAKKLA